MRVIRNIFKAIKLVILGIVVLVVAVMGGLGLVKKSDSSPPSGVKATWEIQTTSRIYFGGNYKVVNGVPELIGYWSLDNSNYTFHQGTISFPLSSYGQVTVIPRFNSSS